MSSEVRVRFAPSPTGYLHVGGARTALFNYLFAKHHGGSFILRIEDTDRTRYQSDALDEIFTSLRWLGLTWDEGPEIEGSCGPYFQSERTSLYREKVDALVESGHAYPCFCSSQRLQKLREEQEKAKLAHVSGYDRHCRNLSQDEVTKRISQNEPHVYRLKIPDNRIVSFTDMIRGEIEYKSETLDDLVLLKSDGFPTYHLANVVDDHLMGITHVMRGDEWIASTPRHVLLYEAFGWDLPVFAHLPVILAPGGGKLSKRKGAASVLDYKRAGYLPEGLVNFLALLGWAPGNDQEKMSSQELVDLFTLERVSPKASVFDEQKLEWMNGLYMQERSVGSLLEEAHLVWKEAGEVSHEQLKDMAYLSQVIGLLKDRSKTLKELATNSFYFFNDPNSYEEKAVKKRWKGDALTVLQSLTSLFESMSNFSQQSLEDAFNDYAQKKELSLGKLIHPTRLAVSGVSFGPGLYEMLELIGQETVVRRMKNAVLWLDNFQKEKNS